VPVAERLGRGSFFVLSPSPPRGPHAAPAERAAQRRTRRVKIVSAGPRQAVARESARAMAPAGPLGEARAVASGRRPSL